MSLRNELQGQENRYLQQHAQDPVAWQLWSPETLEAARRLDKPILLSIGYSACHWCQVMQKESFSDPEIAQQLNEHFVSIKVDKEERPDLDDIFQTAHQLLNGQPGGWPLTVFLCPKSHVPFVVGTYFPREPSHGRIPLEDLLYRVTHFYREQHKEFQNLRDQMGKSFKALNDLPETDPPELADLYLLHEATRRLLEQADTEHGGFGGAPKFVLPFNLFRLLETVSEASELAGPAEIHLRLTLDRIAASAVHDAIDGGFFRYAADAAWEQPHFEKMLFDNAIVIGLYAAAGGRLKDPLYTYVARQTLRWLRRALAVPNGFGASLDSSTGDGDGSAYRYTRMEIKAAVTEEEYTFLNELYGLERKLNDDFLLHCARSPEEAAHRVGIAIEDATRLFDSAREKLRVLRYQKPLADRDEKVICSWNALLCKSMAQVSRFLGDAPAIQQAQQLMDQIVARHWFNKRLFSVVKKSGERTPAFLDDYAFMLLALLDMLRIQWRDSDYHMARNMAEGLLNHFYDPLLGGFFFVANDHEPLPFKPKPFADTMTPSGNGAAALALIRFGHLTAEPRYVDAASATVSHAMPLLRRQPEAHFTLLQAMREVLLPKPVVLMLGDAPMVQWAQTLQAKYQDQIYVYRVPLASEFHPPEVMVMDENTAVICEADLCQDGHESLESLMQALDRALLPTPVEEA
ncbi:thioredoxin domain-containing protein [Simiduia aestuariiviva]|uniref:Spermatogenesis-associated protein 20-like TRX domain-containing protein n=1 Tax=Simiduia aestuariiviva TaxID=1510459 RepID=A0A839US31_9GAMM|nr:thioredoxin domain-containing protein [Simiduia aestuariiviva]MBB3169269.1 hypothetical protein [Simiduia aestuariiviva]